MLSFPTANHIHKASSRELFVQPAGPGPHCVNWDRRPLRTETRRLPIRWTWGDGERRWRKEMEAGPGAICSPLCNPRSEERWFSERDSVKTQKQRREAEWKATWVSDISSLGWGAALPGGGLRQFESSALWMIHLSTTQGVPVGKRWAKAMKRQPRASVTIRWIAFAVVATLL